MPSLYITPQIALDTSEIEERFIQASGPGGQNVNKVATAVQLRFDVARSPSLPDAVRKRLMILAGRRLTQDGVLILIARTHRTQDRNRAEARERLADLVRRATVAPKPRVATRPTLGSKRRRLDAKSVRASIKQNRSRPSAD